MRFLIRPIEDDDSVRWLKLGDEKYLPLKVFLTKQAKHFHRHEFAKTFVIIEEENPNRIGAFLTLVCSEIENIFDNGEEFLETSVYKTLPAVKLARMAVDKRWRGIGSPMMDWCIAHVIDSIMPAAGCRFLVVDAKHDAIGFYEKAGFRLLDTIPNKQSDSPLMFMDLAKIKAAS